MKLRYKITLVITAISLVSIVAIALFYANFLLQGREKFAREKLSDDAHDLAFHIEQNLLDDLHMVQTMKSAFIVENTLEKSNRYYKSFSKETREKKIAQTNKKWMNTEDINDPFFKPYIHNKLAKYLKAQIDMFPSLYGEIFITNRYGAVVASTGKLTTFKHANKYWWKESYDYGYGKIFLDDRGFDDSVGGYVLGFVIPIKKNGVVIGILKANINVHSALAQVIKEHNNDRFDKALVARTKGEVVYEEGFPPLSTKLSKQIVEKLKTLKTGVSDINTYSQNYIVSYAPIKISLRDRDEDIVFGGQKSSIDHLLGNDGEIWHVVIKIDKNRIFNFILSDLRRNINIALGFILFLAIFIFIIMDKISTPLKRLSQTATKIGKGERDIEIVVESNDEIGELATSFKNMLQNLKETTASKKELAEEITKRIQAEEELQETNKILLAQSKQAAMGEIIGMIAHQWRQPISVISMAVNNIMIDIELDDLKEESIKECSNEILNEAKYLSQTIDDFRNFFKPNKEKEIFLVQKLFDDIYRLIGKSFENNDIELDFLGDTAIEINTYKNELLQVFINILNNAKDALVASHTEIRKVTLHTYKKEDRVIFEFCDNAGGIKEEFMDRIFEPYFSTKDEKNGTGIGLYMSKTIMEKHIQGGIWAENRGDGACFMLEVPINLEGKHE